MSNVDALFSFDLSDPVKKELFLFLDESWDSLTPNKILVMMMLISGEMEVTSVE